MPPNTFSTGDWIVSAGSGEVVDNSDTSSQGMTFTEAQQQRMLEILERVRTQQIQPTPDSEPIIFRRHPGTFANLDVLGSDEEDDFGDSTTDALEELIMADMARPKAHDEEAIRKLMKKRHLLKPERDQLHNPEPDFIESSRGEACRSACTLDVSDIIIKHKLK